MASPNMKKLNDSIPKPSHFGEIYIEGNPNKIKDMKLRLKRLTRGNTRGKRNGKDKVKFSRDMAQRTTSGVDEPVPPKE